MLEERTAPTLSKRRTPVGLVMIVCALCGLNEASVLTSLLSLRRKAANYYELLGVKSDASSDEIKNAFFDKSKKVGSLFVNKHSVFQEKVLPEEGSMVFFLQPFPRWAS